VKVGERDDSPPIGPSNENPPFFSWWGSYMVRRARFLCDDAGVASLPGLPPPACRRPRVRLTPVLSPLFLIISRLFFRACFCWQTANGFKVNADASRGLTLRLLSDAARPLVTFVAGAAVIVITAHVLLQPPPPPCLAHRVGLLFIPPAGAVRPFGWPAFLKRSASRKQARGPRPRPHAVAPKIPLPLRASRVSWGGARRLAARAMAEPTRYHRLHRARRRQSRRIPTTFWRTIGGAQSHTHGSTWCTSSSGADAVGKAVI